MVASLLTASGQWDVDKVCHGSLEEEAHLILSIPVNGLKREDDIFWGFDKKGMFLVKSAYQLGSRDEGSLSLMRLHGCLERSLEECCAK